jgi:tetratricopeptide (TPR) repeat protein/tRNA A-37 threonylcarbamoyl transferase component Bud32
MEANEKIGPYRLMEPIGAGGMGTVWRAWDERLKRPVALKQFHSDALDNPRLRERFRREAEAQARLNHPAIVRIYDLIEMDAGDWIVMELVEGQTLQGLLETGLCDVQQSIRLGREIAEGLAEAHRHGLIHRDLKAANVMVTPSGHAKILDFGIVKQIQAEPQDTTVSVLGLVVGTSYAMSPEQSMALPLDARSDLFSLGSLLYEMATGIAPFRADTAQATLARVCNFRQRPASTVRPGVPQEFSDLIDRLLEKDPVHRPQDAHEVAALLENLIMTRPFSPKEPSGEAPPGEPEIEQNTRAERFRTFLPAWAQGSGAGPPAPQSLAAAPLAASRARSATLWRAALWGGLILLLAIAAGYVLLRKTAPFDSYVLYQEGAEYLSRYDRKGNLDRAIESFQRVLAKDDHHAAAHASLAKAYWMKLQGESKDPIWLDRALPMARRAVELDDDLAMAWVSLGLIHYSMGDLDEATRNFDQALRLEPRNADAYYGLGRVDEAQKRIPEAEAAHRKAIEIRPDRMYWDELGSLYYRTGKTAEAIRAFEKSIALAPDSFYGYRNLGAALYSQGDLDQAAAQFQKALQIQPDSTLYGNLGNLYFAQGFYDKSVEAFEKALVMPGGANSYLQWGNLGDACRWTPDKKERAREAYLRAIQLLREELRSHPQDVTLRSRLALYRAKRGDRDAALAELAGLETAAGKDARARYRMLVAYEALGARDKALAALGQALRGGFPAEEIRKDPELLALRADPRYHQLIASLGAS